MPKGKTHRGSAKRFRTKPNGTVKRRHANKNHILNKKKSKRKMRLRQTGLVHKGQQRTVYYMLKPCK